ncbi:hypothetical protein NB710_003328 [Xanthomonas sacchari]|nr:hypothetical protein [Xanthomonas sacchari]
MIAVQLEGGDGRGELAGLFLHRARRGGGFFHQRGVLLGALVHLHHGLVDLLDAGGLLLRGGGDLAHDVGDAAHRGHDLAHGAARLVDQGRAFGDAADRLVDQRLDLLGGIGRTLGEGAHLGGDHGEAAALIAGARGLDGRVQCQDVGLEGDAVDHADDVGDLLRRGLDPVHGGDHVADHVAALRGHRGGAGRKLVGLACVLGVLLDRGGQLFHRGGGALQAGRLLFGAARQVAVAAGDLGGGDIDVGGGGMDAADDRRQLRGGGVGVVAHATEHAMELAVHARGQVAGGDGPQQRGQLAQVAVADLHHRVEILHHHPEPVLEAFRVAARAEGAGRGRLRQLLDLLAHRGQVLLGHVHGFGEHGLLAGQAVHVLGQVADRIALDDLQQAHLHRDVRGHQFVGALDHLPVLAGEGVLVHAVADGAARVLPGHLVLGADHAVDARAHDQHVVHQLADLVLAVRIGGALQFAARHRLRQALGRVQLARHPARDQPGGDAGEQHGQPEQRHDQGLGVGQLAAGAVHLPVQFGDVVLGQRHDALEQGPAQRPRLGVGDLLCACHVAGAQRRTHLGVGLQVGLQRLLHAGVHLHLLLVAHHLGDDLLVLRHLRAHLLHALEVVGLGLGIAGARQLRQFVGTEFAQLRAHLGQCLGRRHPIVLDVLELGDGQVGPGVGKAPQHDRQQRGHGEGEDQLVADFQVRKYVHGHSMCSSGLKKGRGAGGQPAKTKRGEGSAAPVAARAGGREPMPNRGARAALRRRDGRVDDGGCRRLGITCSLNGRGGDPAMTGADHEA